MRIPLAWLAEFVSVPVEARRLAEDLTLVGLAVDAVEGEGKDAVLDIDVTTNRVDCMNVYGVAREVSVLYGAPLRPLDLTAAESGAPAGQALAVQIEAGDLCPRFCARVLDVRMGPSPQWLRDRLEAVGVRPINNVVDVTNYVMMEMGHPSHAFDLDRLPGGRLRIRWARDGERLTTLDGVERGLRPGIGLVAGTAGPLALAGIMGGASSEVSESTRAVALEAAYWEPLAIRRAAKALGMHTEASHRFERGADPEGPVAATARIAHLLSRIGAGTARPGLIDEAASPRPRRTARLRGRRIRAVLGCDVPAPRAEAILRGLGFGVLGGAGGDLEVSIPTWRADVAREEDLIEEVGRHHGLNRIPSTLPPAREACGLKPWQRRERSLRELLVGAGLTEVISYAFVSEALSGPLPGPKVALANPLSEEQGILRASLVLPGLLGCLGANLRHGRRDVRIFELGRVFGPGAPLPREERRLAFLLAGAAGPPHWSGKLRRVDVFDAKGLLEATAERLGCGPFGFEPGGAPGFLHPGRSARVVGRDGNALGCLGALHPDLARTWELRDEVVVGEIALDGILETLPAPTRVEPLPRFPEVDRDLSILCDASVPARDLVERIAAAAGDHLAGVAVVDRYEGSPVPEGEVSLTVNLRYQHPERTLTGEEVQASVERVVQALRAAGAEVRGE